MKKGICILIAILAFSSCKKLVSNSNTDFIGYWLTKPNYYLTSIYIDANNKGEYFSEGDNSSVEDDVLIKGIVRCNHNKLKIGPFKKFNIDEAPHEIDTNSLSGNFGSPKPNWQMKLDGVLFYSRKN